MVTVIFMLALGAFIGALMSAFGKAPLWVSVLLLAIIAMLKHLPLG